MDFRTCKKWLRFIYFIYWFNLYFIRGSDIAKARTKETKQEEKNSGNLESKESGIKNCRETKKRVKKMKTQDKCNIKSAILLKNIYKTVEKIYIDRYL